MTESACEYFWAVSRLKSWVDTAIAASVRWRFEGNRELTEKADTRLSEYVKQLECALQSSYSDINSILKRSIIMQLAMLEYQARTANDKNLAERFGAQKTKLEEVLFYKDNPFALTKLTAEELDSEVDRTQLELKANEDELGRLGVY